MTLLDRKWRERYRASEGEPLVRWCPSLDDVCCSINFITLGYIRMDDIKPINYCLYSSSFTFPKFFANKSILLNKAEACSCSFNLLAIIDVRQMAFATVHAIEMRRHESTRTACLRRAHLAQSLHLSGIIYLIVLQYSQLHLLVLVLLLLGLGVSLLLALLSTTQQPQRGEELRIITNSVGREKRVVLELTTAEGESLFSGRDALTRFDGGLDVSDGGVAGQVEDMSPICGHPKRKRKSQQRKITEARIGHLPGRRSHVIEKADTISHESKSYALGKHRETV